MKCEHERKTAELGTYGCGRTYDCDNRARYVYFGVYYCAKHKPVGSDRITNTVEPTKKLT